MLEEVGGDHRNADETAGLLATAYQTSTSLLLKQGDHGNAWLAVGRASSSAAGTPTSPASSSRWGPTSARTPRDLGQFQRIIATTDVHSAFDTTVPMLAHLHTTRRDSLVVDCGDSFEGTGYYRLGQGRIERDVLVHLYDVIASGNHGWAHYFEPDLHRITVCSNAVDDGTGTPPFQPVRLVNAGTRRLAVTGVISPQASNAIPTQQRTGHRVVERRPQLMAAFASPVRADAGQPEQLRRPSRRNPPHLHLGHSGRPPTNPTEPIEIEPNGFELQPGQLYLGHTIEEIGSDNFVPLLFGRLGLLVEITTPIGDMPLAFLLGWLGSVMGQPCAVELPEQPVRA